MKCKLYLSCENSFQQPYLSSILMYPQTGTGGLSIMHSDLKRLEPEEYLNDTLIEFGLKYVLLR